MGEMGVHCSPKVQSSHTRTLAARRRRQRWEPTPELSGGVIACDDDWARASRRARMPLRQQHRSPWDAKLRRGHWDHRRAGRAPDPLTNSRCAQFFARQPKFGQHRFVHSTSAAHTHSGVSCLRSAFGFRTAPVFACSEALPGRRALARRALRSPPPAT